MLESLRGFDLFPQVCLSLSLSLLSVPSLTSPLDILSVVECLVICAPGPPISPLEYEQVGASADSRLHMSSLLPFSGGLPPRPYSAQTISTVNWVYLGDGTLQYMTLSILSQITTSTIQYIIISPMHTPCALLLQSLSLSRTRIRTRRRTSSRLVERCT